MLIFLIFFLSLFSACVPQDESWEAPEPTAEGASSYLQPIVGSYWGWYGTENYFGYALDGEGCTKDATHPHTGYVFVWDDQDVPAETTCANVGQSLGFQLELHLCVNLPEEARVTVIDCQVSGGVVEDLSITWTPTYSDGSNPSDGYGDVYVQILLDNGSTLEVEGPYSHCAGGEPCDVPESESNFPQDPSTRYRRFPR